ncbi:hypothetical protein FQN52_008121 [Onygenales sp. PD_12]|nr:hypothetical protein FQN52_008121 [Onygenales sp. PD_12]
MISKTDPRREQLLNREAPLNELVARSVCLFPVSRSQPQHAAMAFLTPAPDAYNRNHSAIPALDAATHTVAVGGDVAHPLRLSVAQLRADFAQHEVLCALQCAGNRRHTMRTKLKEVVGLDWMDGAVMNCAWRGPRLRDVLERAGVRADNKGGMHVVFECNLLPCEDDSYYGGSIELWRALEEDREVILALEMNGKPLQPSYGYPVRVVVPGVAGARWVKWLDTISVQPRESPNFYQQHDYKILPPEATTWEIAEDYWPKVPAMQCMPVNSVVAVPGDDETVHLPPSGMIEVKGFAVPHGAEGPVTRVEVSADGGRTWVDATIDEGGAKKSKWSWVLFTAQVRVERGAGKTIYSRATDRGGNVQEERSPWNLRGVGYNGYGASWNVEVV